MSNIRYLTVRLKSHKDKVCSLYKRAIRNNYSRFYLPEDIRYAVVTLRKRFDDNKDIKDMRIAKKLLEEGEKEYEDELYYQPLKFGFSPGGINYRREAVVPDWVLDYWHPLEKAQYPEYFALREQRKKEYIERWEKKYGKPVEEDPYHH